MVPAMPAFECNESVLRVGGDADIATRRIEIIDNFSIARNQETVLATASDLGSATIFSLESSLLLHH